MSHSFVCKNTSPVREWSADAWNAIKGRRGSLVRIDMAATHMLLSDGASHLIHFDGEPEGRDWWMHPEELLPA